MPNYNKCLLMGNLTRDPELKQTPNNQSVAQIGIALNRKFKDRDGNMREETTYVDCEAWGRTAEVMAQYLSKGKPVFVEGRLKLDQWQDKDGNNRSKLQIIVNHIIRTNLAPLLFSQSLLIIIQTIMLEITISFKYIGFGLVNNLSYGTLVNGMFMPQSGNMMIPIIFAGLFCTILNSIISNFQKMNA